MANPSCSLSAGLMSAELMVNNMEPGIMII